MLPQGMELCQLTPHPPIPAGLRRAGTPNDSAFPHGLQKMPLPHYPSPTSPPTLKTNRGWAGRGQAFPVVSFTGEHSALGHPWGQKTSVSSLPPVKQQLPFSLGLGKMDT